MKNEGGKVQTSLYRFFDSPKNPFQPPKTPKTPKTPLVLFPDPKLSLEPSFQLSPLSLDIDTTIKISQSDKPTETKKEARKHKFKRKKSESKPESLKKIKPDRKKKKTRKRKQKHKENKEKKEQAQEQIGEQQERKELTEEQKMILENKQKHKFAEQKRRDSQNEQFNLLRAGQLINKLGKDGKVAKVETIREAVKCYRLLSTMFQPRKRNEERSLAMKQLQELYPVLDLQSFQKFLESMQKDSKISNNSLSSPFAGFGSRTGSPWQCATLGQQSPLCSNERGVGFGLGQQEQKQSSSQFPPFWNLNSESSSLSFKTNSETSFTTESKRQVIKKQGIAWCSIDMKSLEIKEMDGLFFDFLNNLLFDCATNQIGTSSSINKMLPNHIPSDMKFSILLSDENTLTTTISEHDIQDQNQIRGRNGFQHIMFLLQEKREKNIGNKIQEMFSGIFKFQGKSLASIIYPGFPSSSWKVIHKSFPVTIVCRTAVCEIGIFFTP
jgi:hypothetical protein